MPSNDREELHRISAESHQLTNAARSSCDDTNQHIRSSREAIARSLQLLGRRFNQMFD
jgi:hypothetical protein